MPAQKLELRDLDRVDTPVGDEEVERRIVNRCRVATVLVTGVVDALDDVDAAQCMEDREGRPLDTCSGP